MAPGIDHRGYLQSINKQRNRISRVVPGSFVMVPRLGDGVVHVASVVGEFRVFNPSVWADDYLALRQRRGLSVVPEYSHVGDVMQGWKTGDWSEIPFPAIPRWISQRMLTRDTFGLVSDAEDGRTAWETLRRVVESGGAVFRAPVRTVEQVVSRMQDILSPASFEQLCVELLQLLHPGDVWVHVGGSGDGGADGVGYRPSGAPAGVLQCKFEWPGVVADPRSGPVAVHSSTRLVVASLIHGSGRPPGVPSGAEWMGSSEVAELVLRYRHQLPLARTLGVEVTDAGLQLR